MSWSMIFPKANSCCDRLLQGCTKVHPMALPELFSITIQCEGANVEQGGSSCFPQRYGNFRNFDSTPCVCAFASVSMHFCVESRVDAQGNYIQSYQLFLDFLGLRHVVAKKSC